MVNTYLDTFPPFVPSEDDGLGVEAQEHFYQFINGLYHRLADEPTLLFRNLHDDDAHTHRFNKGADNKPKLKRWMRKVVKDVDDLLKTMLLMGQHGRVEADTLVVEKPVKVSKKHARVLAELALHRSEEPDGVDHNGTDYRLCPYYPGYSYCWEGLSDELVDNCIAMLDYMARLFDR